MTTEEILNFIRHQCCPEGSWIGAQQFYCGPVPPTVDWNTVKESIDNVLSCDPEDVKIYANDAWHALNQRHWDFASKEYTLLSGCGWSLLTVLDELRRKEVVVRPELLSKCLKPEEIAGDNAVKDRRVRELIFWFSRYSKGRANPKWLESHAMELAHYCAEIKGVE